MIQIANFGDITQIRMGRSIGNRVLYWVAAYLINGLLIDTGCSYTADELCSFLSGEPLEQIYLTHYHEDHIGGSAALQHKYGLTVLSHPATKTMAGLTPKLYPYQEFVWGYPEPFAITALFGNTLKTDHYHFQIVETPGHSPDHTVLIEPEQGWCFSGDLFVSDQIKVLRPEENVGKIIESMQKLIDIETELKTELTLFTAIGKVVPQGGRVLKSCLDHLDQIGTRARYMQDVKGLTTEEIILNLFGGESTMSELTDNQFSCANMVKSLLQYRS